jgi:hypothetical protein
MQKGELFFKNSPFLSYQKNEFIFLNSQIRNKICRTYLTTLAEYSLFD